MNSNQSKKNVKRILAVVIAAASFFLLKESDPELLRYIMEQLNGLYASVSGDGADRVPVSEESFDNAMVVHFIDIGQGDAAYIELPTGESMLIDAGPNASEDDLHRYLDRFHADTIDYAVFTHPHEDHIGGADLVLNIYDVKTVLLPDCDAATVTYERMLDAIEAHNIPVRTAEPGDVYSLGEASFQILAPLSPDSNDLNNASIVLRLTYGETSFLFTGDAEKPSEQEMIERWGTGLQSDVLKAGHHGSSTSSCDAFLDLVQPTIAVISCGQDNDYGHPHREVMKSFTDRGLRIFRTDEMGSVRISTDGEAFSVQRDRGH